MKKIILMLFSFIALITIFSTASVTAKPPLKKSSKKIIVIDPGHQQYANTDIEPIGPGAIKTKYKVTDGTHSPYTNKKESILTLEASKMLGNTLKKRGYKVIYTRTKQNVNISNRERANIANKSNADLFLRIHADGSINKKEKGFSILTTSSKNPYISKSVNKASLVISNEIIQKIEKNKKVKDIKGIIYRDDLSGANWSKVPGVLLELGYMTNKEEDKKLADPLYLKSLTKSIADGVDQYMKKK
ncbi:N-acetylmuramoyl-L-alanine amidase family protein [Viridibacillus arvi]|uniref:N-acetylmuramoyl-L-alanine amidase family protein n=1 Tax=Viridibacillus arvi TaxID=263475 RepID=UPI00187B9A62|nr:N-acetylmuramoyl-L-alanine amidase [Viridibacillus sp. JNUCC-6]QOV10369.1 N-acetylmuramoyl-L-alanine amidase [Viridibacillus sp. JNUCC-6]